MKTIRYTGEKEWLNARIGKITGSRLKDIITKSPFTKDDIVNVLNAKGIEFKKTDTKEVLSKSLSPDDIRYLKSKAEKKMAFYELIAERLALPPDLEKPMDRGHRLELPALDLYEQKTGVKLNKDLIMWVSDTDESIAVSPDAEYADDETQAVEVKCLNSALHIKTVLTKEIPDEYHYQGMQYFAVNEKLQKLHFTFYDDRLVIKEQFFIITLERKDYADEIQGILDFQKDTLTEVNKIVAELSL